MVEIYPHCQSRVLEEAFLEKLRRGWQEVFDLLKGLGEGGIVDLEGVEISLLDDLEMARLHGEFLGDASTTDVITFAHGELLIGVETATRQAIDYQTSFERELALYGIHGMLHLAGYDDRDSDEALLMANRQEEVLGQVFGSF